MLKRIISLFLMASIVLAATPSDVFAQKGRSYSSGKSSSSRSSSSSSRSSPVGKSYSSGSSNKGSSFSTKPSSPPQASSPSGKKYSSGSTPPAVKSSPPSGKQYSPPVKSSPPPTASGTDGKKYSSGNTPPPFTPGKKYSAGNPPPSTGPPAVNDSNSRKPSGSGFGNAMSNDAKRVESQKRYEASTAPKATYASKGADGTSVQQTIKPDSPQVQTVRQNVNHERYVNYDNRASTFYGGHYGSPMYYHDPFSPFLMGWIMSDAINSQQRAMWMYHHQSDMDQARYAEMLSKDAKLQAEIDQLKAQNVTRDPSYVPPQMAENPDLMFNKDFVDASYNPVETEVNVLSGINGAGTFIFWMFVVFVVIVVGGVGVYFLFFKEY